MTPHTTILYVLLAISIAIGGTAHIPGQEKTSVDPQIAVNTAAIEELNQSFEKMAEIQSNDYKLLSTLSEDVKTVQDQTTELLTVDEGLKLQLQQLQDKKAIEVLEKKVVTSQWYQDPPKKTFNLELVDPTGLPKSEYIMNEVVEVIGDVKDASKPSLSVKTRDSLGYLLSSVEIPIPDEGKFSHKFLVPAGFSPGIYTITISDGMIVESINFTIHR